MPLAWRLAKCVAPPEEVVTGAINRSGAYKISEAVLLVCGGKGVSDGTGLRFYRRTPRPPRLLAFFDARTLRRMDDR